MAKVGASPDCKAIVLTFWDMVKARCPKVQKQTLALQAPVELVELVFKLVFLDIIEGATQFSASSSRSRSEPSRIARPSCRPSGTSAPPIAAMAVESMTKEKIGAIPDCETIVKT
jgi:hypothetical protein